jgi:hypothetical protein
MTQCAEAEFRREIHRAIDREKFGVQPGIAPMRSVLEILSEFMTEKVHKPIMEGGDYGKAVQAAYELRDVLDTLVHVGYAELAIPLETLTARLARLHEASLNRLLQIFLDPATPAERAEQIKADLIDIAERGGWDTWREDLQALDDEQWRWAMNEIAELRRARAS